MRPVSANVRHGASAIGLVALVLVAYANSFGVGFPFDNKSIVLDDPRLRAATWANLELILTRDYWWPKFAGGVYRPLTTLSFLLNYAVLGNADRPAGYHLVNVLLHAANVLLAYRVALVVAGGMGTAVATAALFATHPIATEAVTNIVGRADLLAALAVLGGLVAHVQSTRATGWRRGGWLVVVALAAGLGVLAKESAVVLLGVIVLYELVFPPGTGAAAARRIGQAALVVGAPVLALWGLRAWVLAALPSRPWPAVDNPLLAADFWTARLTAIRVIGEYVWLLLWPRWLSPDYSWAQVPLVGWESGGAVLALLAIVGMLVAALRLRPIVPAAAFWIGFFFVTLVPTANVLVLIGSIKAERFLYLPSLGFAGAAVLGAHAALSRLVGPGRAAGRAGAVALALVVGAYGLRTTARNRDWQDPVRLWESAVVAAPRSFKTHQALAHVLASDEASRHRHADRIVDEAEAALRILQTAPSLGEPEPSAVALDVGMYRFLRASDRAGDARLADLRRAAEVLTTAARLDHAEREARQQEARRRGPGTDDVPEVGRWEIYHYLGRTRLELGDAAGAREAFSEARRLVPDDVRPYHGLARAELATGAFEPAAVALHEVLLLDPADPEALPMLLDVYARHDPEGCAVVAGPIRRLDPRCPRVLADRCAAHAALARSFDEARRPQTARRVEAAAPRGCAGAAGRPSVE